MNALEARRAEFEKARDLEVQQAAPSVDPESVSSDVGRAIGGMTDRLGRTAQVLGRQMDLPGVEAWGAQASQAGAESAANFGTARVNSTEDVESVGDAVDLGRRFAVQGAVNIAPIIGATILPVALKYYKTGAAIAGIMSSALNIGEVDAAMEQASGKAGEHDEQTLLTGAGMGLLDSVGAGRILAPIVKRFGAEQVTKDLLEQGVEREAIQSIVKEATKETALSTAKRTALTEAVVETLQEGTKLVSVADATDTPLPENTPYALADAAIGGAIVGGPLGATIGATQGLGDAAVYKSREGLGKIADAYNNSKAAEIFGSASVNLLKPLAKDSQEIQGLLDTFIPDTSGRRVTGPTIEEKRNRMIGESMTKLEQSGLFNLSEQDAANEILAYQQGRRDSAVTQALANVIDGVANKAESVGLDMGKIENYLPTSTDFEKIQANQLEFLQDISPYYTKPDDMLKGYIKAKESLVDADQMTPRVDRTYLEEAEDGTLRVAEKYQKNEDPNQLKYKIGQGGGILPKSHQIEGTRFFNKVPQAIMSKWSKEQSPKDVITALRDYVEATSHRLAVVEKFGPNNEIVNATLARASKELADKNKKLPKEVVNRVYDIVDAYNGVHGLVENKNLRQTLSAVQTVATTAALPLSAASSIVEVLLPAIQGDISASVRAMFPAINQNAKNIVAGVMNTVPKSERAIIASEANITLAAAMNTMSERVNDALLTKGMATYSKWFYVGNGQTPLVHAFKVGSAVTAEQIIKRNLLQLSSGVPLTSQKGTYLANQLRTLGIDVQTRDQAMALYAPKTQSERDAAKESMILGVQRFVSQSNLDPNAFNTAMWMNNGQWRIFAGLKRYASAFTNTIIPQMVRKFDTNYTGGGGHALGAMASLTAVVAGMLLIGSAQDELKRWARGAPTDTRTDNQRLMDIFGVTASPLFVSLIADLFGAARYGSTPSSTFAGPVVGLVDTSVRNINRFYENPTMGNIAKTLLDATPARPFKSYYQEYLE